jgi:hypothetical protein
VSTIGTFPGLVGFFVLTSDGELGYYDKDRNFVRDAKLTKAFADYNRQYLMAYLRNPDQGNFRLALIHRSQEEKPWGSYTLLLEKHIVRRLYPVAGMTVELDLTAFQKKNREKSIYRGMELFLEYKDTSTPELPVYCPVLYDRKTSLNDYASNLDRQVTPADRDTPVVEVINLLAAIPSSRRTGPEIAILKEKIYHGIVKKGMRKSAEFSLIEDMRRNARSARGENVDPYSDIDKRSGRQVTLDSLAGHDKSAEYNPNDSALISRIGVALLGRPEPADPMVMKNFSRFRDLAHDKLVALAAQSFVYKVPPGTPLLERGTSDTWNFYLLEGTLQLLAADGMEKRIDSATDTARNPISSLKPRMYTVTALTRVTFLWIDDRLVEQIVQGISPAQRREGTA